METGDIMRAHGDCASENHVDMTKTLKMPARQMPIGERKYATPFKIQRMARVKEEAL